MASSKSFTESRFSETDVVIAAPLAEAGTVLKAFNGPTRRFPVDYVLTDADVRDLPMSRDDLKAGDFIA